MATKNLSFKDAINFRKQNHVTSAFSYAHLVNKQPVPIPPIISPPLYFQPISVPVSSTINSHQFTKKFRHRFPPRLIKHFNIPAQDNFSLPNGSFINYASKTNSATESSTKNSDFSWINNLAFKLFESLINSPNFSSHSATSHQNIIESFILSLLNIFTHVCLIHPRFQIYIYNFFFFTST